MMAQFDIYRRADEGIAFLLDLQDDMLEVLSTRVVAPMVPEGAVGPAMRDLNPILTQGGLPTKDRRPEAGGPSLLMPSPISHPPAPAWQCC